MTGLSHAGRGLLALMAGFALVLAVVEPAAAYVGPGAGLTAVGVVMGIVAALLLAVAGFVWYPLKRMLRGRGASAKPAQTRKPATRASSGGD